MSKLTQLQQLRRLGLPVPPFRELSYADWRAGRWSTAQLRFPLAVRSTYSAEDGTQRSYAGHFHTATDVAPAELDAAIEAVFASYPAPAGQSVVLQEMIAADYSGVLFAYRDGVWLLEYGAGAGDDLVGGRRAPRRLLLPRFDRWDVCLARWWRFWTVVLPHETLRRPLLQLSAAAGTLLAQRDAPAAGLDIECCFAEGQLYLLQARPITTPAAAQELLTSANHKEILPAAPSALMHSLIVGAGPALFAYYRRLDGDLPARSFVRAAAGMPWINLSALYDTMVQWGLPTGLVADSVGATDLYRVGLRPWRAVRQLGVFLQLAYAQLTAGAAVRRWVAAERDRLAMAQAQRRAQWPQDAPAALRGWADDARRIYVGLVEQMQALTGAMSGPVGLLERWGMLAELRAYPSPSTDYQRAFAALQAGTLNRANFLAEYGHRGFYESDLGRPRFRELAAEDWAKLLAGPSAPLRSAPPRIPFWRRPLLRFTARLIHRREWLRHMTMHLFDDLRKELTNYGPPDPWQYTLRRLFLRLGAGDPGTDYGPLDREPPVGWDQNTFLADTGGTRTPLPAFGLAEGSAESSPLTIYPGCVRGRVWRVRQAGLASLTPPAVEGPLILVADALDPGFIPYFGRVVGVAAYTGGLLSHASIILREAGIPALTQLPAHEVWTTGDSVELNANARTLTRL
jgi:pyruvate,water dikinase